MSATTLQANPILLLQTKLYRPQAYSDQLSRPHLIQHLNQGLQRKLTLVAAPAGYGKTTIVTQWLDHLQTQQPLQPNNFSPQQIAWLSLDESDNDLSLFVHYLVATIQQCHPDSCATTFAALHNPQPLPASRLVTLLLNDLITLSERLILVLDDYHFVVAEEIHKFLDRLLDHLPPLLHLVLISRTEPPLSLPRLRVRRQMNELRMVELSFSNGETEIFLSQGRDKSLTSVTISALQERSQGWIAGLYLAKLSLGQNSDEQELLKQLQANNTHIMDYLITEVLMQQPQAVQNFLLYTSILRRFCRPLCETLLADNILSTDNTSSGFTLPISTIIDQLARHHLFTIPLDDSDTWYRYHHLFQLMLTRRLQKHIGTAAAKALHQKASRWFAEEGLIDEALHHALAADDTPFAIQLVAQHGVRLLNQFDYHSIKRWLDLLPQTAVSKSPRLLLLKCWLAVSTYRLTNISIPQHLRQVEALLINTPLDEAEQTILKAEIAAIRIISYHWNNEFQQVINSYQQAILDLPASHLFMRTYLIMYAAFALRRTGRPNEAIHLIQSESQLARATAPTQTHLWLRNYLAPFYFMTGELDQAIHAAQAILDSLPDPNKLLASRPLRWLGSLHYEHNDLEAARRYLSAVSDIYIPPYYSSQLNLAWLYEIEGQPEAAAEVVEKLHRWALERKSNDILNEIASFRARCLCWQGDISKALGAIREVKIVKDVFNFKMEVPSLTLAQILIKHDEESSWQEAETLLEELRADITRAQNVPGKISLLALNALLYQRQEKVDDALDALREAIELAKSGGFVRTFVDLGTPMASLLYQLLEQGVEPDYLSHILAAFPQAEPSQAYAQRAQQVAQTQLIEPLTRRELDVLRLLAQELPNKKIAQQLSISPLTVKRHTINIYQKLSVSNRHDAVQTAKALGIAPS